MCSGKKQNILLSLLLANNYSQTKFETHGIQTAISTVYALLNEITRYTQTNGEATYRAKESIISGAPAVEQLNEKQKQQVCANVLSAIVGIAVYIKDAEVRASIVTRTIYLTLFYR